MGFTAVLTGEGKIWSLVSERGPGPAGVVAVPLTDQLVAYLDRVELSRIVQVDLAVDTNITDETMPESANRLLGQVGIVASSEPTVGTSGTQFEGGQAPVWLQEAAASTLSLDGVRQLPHLAVAAALRLGPALGRQVARRHAAAGLEALRSILEVAPPDSELVRDPVSRARLSELAIAAVDLLDGDVPESVSVAASWESTESTEDQVARWSEAENIRLSPMLGGPFRSGTKRANSGPVAKTISAAHWSTPFAYIDRASWHPIPGGVRIDVTSRVAFSGVAPKLTAVVAVERGVIGQGAVDFPAASTAGSAVVAVPEQHLNTAVIWLIAAPGSTPFDAGVLRQDQLQQESASIADRTRVEVARALASDAKVSFAGLAQDWRKLSERWALADEPDHAESARSISEELAELHRVSDHRQIVGALSQRLGPPDVVDSLRDAIADAVGADGSTHSTERIFQAAIEGTWRVGIRSLGRALCEYYDTVGDNRLDDTLRATLIAGFADRSSNQDLDQLIPVMQRLAGLS